METALKSEVKEINWPEKIFITTRATLPFEQLSSFFTEKYGSIYSAIYKMGLQANEPPCAIYYSVDEIKKETDLAAAVPVTGPVPELVGFEKVVIPASKALTITHYGPFESMTETYSLLQKYLDQHGLKTKWMIEQYLSDPAVEKDPANWKTNIYFVLN